MLEAAVGQTIKPSPEPNRYTGVANFVVEASSIQDAALIRISLPALDRSFSCQP
jgi:hypothetical protein